jgi:pimeloyl-ACP methyl ester carboxylesterase
MRAIIRDGIALAYEETGAGTPPVLLVHGWGCDHSFLAPQAEHFSRNHRVVSVDLRGHGASDAPRQEYTVAGFADDLGFLCDRLDLHEAVVVGHSMGGNIALELAARRPDLTAAVVIIDSVAFPPPALLEALRPLADALRGPGYVEALHAAVSPLFLPVDDPGRKARILTAMARTPQHVLASAFVGHVMAYDARAAATACRVPVAYIGAAVPLADLSEFRTVCPPPAHRADARVGALLAAGGPRPGEREGGSVHRDIELPMARSTSFFQVFGEVVLGESKTRT